MPYGERNTVTASVRILEAESDPGGSGAVSEDPACRSVGSYADVRRMPRHAGPSSAERQHQVKGTREERAPGWKRPEKKPARMEAMEKEPES